MKIAARTTSIERLDEAPGLLFRVRTEYHWISRSVTVILAFACVAIVLSDSLGIIAACILAVVAAAALHRVMRGRITELRITPTTFFATGDLGGYGNGHLRLRVSDLQELHYAPAGAGQSNGLYAREGEWCSRCVLPRLTEMQANAIVAEIVIRHPHLLFAGSGVVPVVLGSLGSLEGEARAARSRWRPVWGHQNTAALGASRSH